MLLTFSKERLVFDARDCLPGMKTSIINLPVSIELKFYDGVAPCGLALEIKKEELNIIKEKLLQENIEINDVFEVDENDNEYKRVEA